MGNKSTSLNKHHKQFIEQQKLFFVATAAPTGYINLSPKGTDSFRVVNDTRVVWLNLTGSGNETAAHVLEDSRMTIMMNAFEGNPMILRLYGQARVIHKRDEDWEKYNSLFEPNIGARQIFELDIEMVQTSCGFGVPLMEYKGDRTELERWTDKKGEAGVLAYQLEKNTISLNGKPTGLVEG